MQGPSVQEPNLTSLAVWVEESALPGLFRTAHACNGQYKIGKVFERDWEKEKYYKLKNIIFLNFLFNVSF